MTNFSDKQILEARNELWRKGNLSWKNSPTQNKIQKFLDECKTRIAVLNLGRRSGKSFLLCLLGIAVCLRKKKATVKMLQPEQKMCKTNINPIIEQIIEDCPPDLRPKFHTPDSCWYFPNGSRFQIAGTDKGNYKKLRGGDCLTGDTLIATPQGPKAIRDINSGDVVYGFNKDGSISETNVVAKHETGVKRVRDLYIRNNKVAGCSDEHKWITNTISCLSRGVINYTEKPLKDFHCKNDRVVRSLVSPPMGSIDVPDSYLIGAFLGDGCCTNLRGNQLYIASGNTIIPDKCAEILDCQVVKDMTCKNRYKLTTSPEKNKHSEKLHFSYYDDWLKGKNHLSKNFDIKVVTSWNRSSILRMIAGLIDTDGCVYRYHKENTLELSYTSCNRHLINNIDELMFSLYQVRGRIKSRKKDKGYVQYTYVIKNNLYVKRILKELSPHLALEYKKYLPEYDDIKSSSKEHFVKVSPCEEYYYAETYDLSVDNETHLYLTADGLVTHNSDLCLIDEAGFVADDLGHIIRSVLLPTTLRTRGKIILSSTTPVDAEHEFLTYMEKAESQDALYTATLYDVLDDWEESKHPEPLLTRELLQEIILEYPMGEDDEEFRRECLNELVTDGERNIIPEFDKTVQEDCIVEWPRPVFCDKYVFMDIGFVDLTVALFGYVDFDNAVLCIEDEIVMNGPSMTTPVLAQAIKNKEEELWRDKVTGEMEQPHLRVADQNLIVINDMQKHHGLVFKSSSKDDLFAAVNRTRTIIGQRQVMIHPRCTTLINHIKHGLWNKNKTKFNRTQGKNGHHYDALAALVIGIRNVDFTHNPYPKGYRRDIVSRTGDIYLNPQAMKKYDNNQHSQFSDLFKVKSSIGGVKKPKKINK